MRRPCLPAAAGSFVGGTVLLALAAGVVPAVAQQSSPRTSSAEVFDSLWGAFDATYALFEDKRVPWEQVRDAYRPRAVGSESEADLFDVLSEMLALLNDNHVKLVGWGQVMSAAGGLRRAGVMSDFSPRLIRDSYLASPAVERVDGSVSFGWLADSVGYIHVRGMSDVEASGAAIDEALGTFRAAPGVVLDLRGNFGGDDPVGQAIARRFADRPRRYMSTRLKRGPGADSFTAPRHWTIAPGPNGGYTRPVAVLVHGYTFSAAENLVLAFRTLPHATIVGTATSGSMGETTNDVLPNGWVYRTVLQRIVDPQGRSWEGVGIPPDLRVENTPAEVEGGRDRALEAASALVASGPSARRRLDASLDRASRALELPLADSLSAWIDEHPLGHALSRFRRARSDSARWFLAEDWEYGDLTTLGRRLFQSERLDAALAVLSAAAEAYPESYRPHAALVDVHTALGRPAEAEGSRRRALALNPGLYHEDRRVLRVLEGETPSGYEFLRLLFSEGPEAAIREYRAMRGRAGGSLPEDPLLLVRGGQQMREAGQYDAALRVFSFAAELFPDWPLGHLGVAEIHRSTGAEDEAVRAYRRVLEADPDNRRAREATAALER